MSPPVRPGGSLPPRSPTPGPDPTRSRAKYRPSPAPAAAGSAESARRGNPSSDLALLLSASLALILPGWLAAPTAGRPSLSGTCEAPLRIDVNSSAWYEWTLFEGIGEARARRIVEARRQQGGFSSLDDLEGIPGMPEGWVAKIRAFLTLAEGRAGRPASDDATMETGKESVRGSEDGR